MDDPVDAAGAFRVAAWQSRGPMVHSSSVSAATPSLFVTVVGYVMHDTTRSRRRNPGAESTALQRCGVLVLSGAARSVDRACSEWEYPDPDATPRPGCHRYGSRHRRSHEWHELRNRLSPCCSRGRRPMASSDSYAMVTSSTSTPTPGLIEVEISPAELTLRRSQRDPDSVVSPRYVELYRPTRDPRLRAGATLTFWRSSGATASPRRARVGRS